MPKQRDPKLVWDADVAAYRAIDQAPRHVPNSLDEKRGAAKATVSQLLAQSFGRKLSTGSAGLQVPAHLRKYVQRAPDAPRD